MTPLYGRTARGWDSRGRANDCTWTGRHMCFWLVFLWRPKPGVTTVTIGYNHPKFFVAAKTRGYNHPRGESSLVYSENNIQINFPHAGWPALFVVMFVVWSGPLHVPGGSHVGELPVRWLWNPGERRGNTSTLDELPVWWALQHWNTRGAMRSQLGVCGSLDGPDGPRPAVGWRSGVPISKHHVTQSTPAFFPRRQGQTPVTPPHVTPRAQRKQSCRGNELLAI